MQSIGNGVEAAKRCGISQQRLNVVFFYTLIYRNIFMGRLNFSHYWLLLILIFVIPVSNASPTVYLFLGRGPAKSYQSLLKNPNIKGAQIIYYWRELEPKENIYNFNAINADLKFLRSLNKSLYIQIQDRSFSPKIIPVPDYLLDRKYDGGIAEQMDFPGEGKALSAGWVTKQWVPNVHNRFQKLLTNLGNQFDGKIKGINLPETAIDINGKKAKSDFNCDRYFDSIISNLKLLRSAFQKSDVVQYVNFFPSEWNNDHHYMSRLFDFAKKNNIGLGGPDVVPYRRGQMKNSYPFFNHNKGKLPLVAFAVQEPDYTYTDSKTGKHYTIEQVYDFANAYLGANILFWNTQQPQYTQKVLPFLNIIKNS